MVGFLNVSPDLKAAYGRQFCRGIARELKVIKVGTDVKISPQGGQILLPPSPLCSQRKCTWSPYDFCKDVGNQLLGVDSKQIPGGDVS